MTVICETNKRSVIVLTPNDERLTGAVIQEMRAVINCNNLEHVIIDFTAIRYLMGGSAVGPLVKLNQELRSESRQLVFCNLSTEIVEVFRISKLIKIFEVSSNVAVALAKLREK